MSPSSSPADFYGLIWGKRIEAVCHRQATSFAFVDPVSNETSISRRGQREQGWLVRNGIGGVAKLNFFPLTSGATTGFLFLAEAQNRDDSQKLRSRRKIVTTIAGSPPPRVCRRISARAAASAIHRRNMGRSERPLPDDGRGDPPRQQSAPAKVTNQHSWRDNSPHNASSGLAGSLWGDGRFLYNWQLRHFGRTRSCNKKKAPSSRGFGGIDRRKCGADGKSLFVTDTRYQIVSRVELSTGRVTLLAGNPGHSVKNGVIEPVDGNRP